jgi:muramoyltetrapeptide carboxypeptidase
MISPLRPGDGIALVAPSSPFPVEKFHAACGILEGRGYRVVPGKHIFQKRGYLAGAEAERAEDLIHALNNPEVSAVFCIRGGFGSSRLLPWFPFSVLPESPKILLGYSDTTCLHLAFWTKRRWATFHGPNVIDLVDFPESVDNVMSALSGTHEFSWAVEDRCILRHGTASGTLLGGNLTCLCHLLGSPYFPDLRDALLLLEDRGEALYRLDRLLTQLKLAGVFDHLRGLILGRFEECGEPRNVRDMVMEQVKYYSFPVVADLPFGHGSPNEVIPLGPSFLLNTYERTFKTVAGFPFGPVE